MWNKVAISAQEARKKELEVTLRPDTIQKFNELILHAIKNNKRSVCLPFDTFGSSWTNIKWVQDLGYIVSRNSACLWWEVVWESKA